jgi:hypothetical protein
MNKDKILKPYEQTGDGNYVRYSLTHIYYGVVYKHSSINVWYSSENWSGDDQLGISIPYGSKEEAMAATDEALIKEGFTILTQEQYEKLLLLL